MGGRRVFDRRIGARTKRAAAAVPPKSLRVPSLDAGTHPATKPLPMAQRARYARIARHAAAEVSKMVDELDILIKRQRRLAPTSRVYV